MYGKRKEFLFFPWTSIKEKGGRQGHWMGKKRKEEEEEEWLVERNGWRRMPTSKKNLTTDANGRLLLLSDAHKNRIILPFQASWTWKKNALCFFWGNSGSRWYFYGGSLCAAIKILLRLREMDQEAKVPGKKWRKPILPNPLLALGLPKRIAFQTRSLLEWNSVSPPPWHFASKSQKESIDRRIPSKKEKTFRIGVFCLTWFPLFSLMGKWQEIRAKKEVAG